MIDNLNILSNISMHDPFRPVWHYLPEEGLLWDPCAAIYYKDQYHFFYLHSSWKESGIPLQENGLYPNCNDVTAWIEEDSCFAITGTRES